MFSNSKILKDHEEYLRKNLFFTSNKWPQYNLLFKDVKKISKRLKKKQKVLILERTNLYGGRSLFSPFFNQNEVVSVDCVTKDLLKRGAYNSKKLNNSKIIEIKSQYQFDYKKINLKKREFDFILIPNLMHHIEDPSILIKQSYNFLKKGGKIYIFEPLLRELHQAPEDYFRFTPYGLKYLLKKNNYNKTKFYTTGGPFTAILYFWDQALQYLNGSTRKKREKWFKKEFKELLRLENKFKKNLLRKNTISPTAFSIIAQK